MRIEAGSNNNTDFYREFIDENNYWIKKLEGIAGTSCVQVDFDGVEKKEPKRTIKEYRLDNGISEGIRKISNSKHGCFIVILSAIMILIKKYSDNEDILVAMPEFIRDGDSQAENKLLPIRCCIKGSNAFKSLLMEIKNVIAEADSNSYCPYQVIAHSLAEQLNCAMEEVFKVAVAMPGIHDDSIFKTINSGILFMINESAREVAISVQYDANEYKPDTIDRLANHLRKTLQKVIENTDTCIDEIEISGEEERNKVLLEFNVNSDCGYSEATIIDLFEQQVKNTPDKKAVVFKDKSITYSELNSGANQIAQLLQAKGAAKNHLVALLVERSLYMITGIMGILKAGAAYLPIDPNNPEDRIRFILEDSKSTIIISQRDILEKFSLDIEAIDISSDSVYEGDGENPKSSIQAEDLAYAIYTSGTSGEPKGSLIEHRNVVNLVKGLSKHIYGKYGMGLNVALIASYAFDASVQQIFSSLLGGHTLFIVPDEVKMDTEKLISFYRDNSIDISDGTPSHVKILAYGEISDNKRLGIKHFIIGGEVLYCKTVKELYKRFAEDSFEITNIYGLTECCVDSTVVTLDRSSRLDYKVVPIGSPMTGQSIYILDSRLNPVPIGIEGDIYIAGNGVGKGYLNRPELTEKLFLCDIQKPGKKMFRTGDVGRWTNDGNIRIAGRKDRQVKINGYRIEIEEIEAVLASHELISEAAVVIKENEPDDKFLCAFTVQEGVLEEAELRSCLQHKLPYYMIPKHFIKLEKLPVNQNGKVDRSYLGRLDIKAFEGVSFVPPRNEKEQAIADIWKETLRIDKVGIHDNFFKLGGDSVKAVLVLGKMKKKKLVIEVRDFFEHASIAEIVKYIKDQGTELIKSGKSMENSKPESNIPAEELDDILKEIDDIDISH